MASISELMDGHITLEVECLDRLYLNGYIGRLATPGGLVMFMRDQLGKPIPSPVVLRQITEKFREAVKAFNGGRSTDNSSSTVTRRSTSTTTISTLMTKTSVRSSSGYAATHLGESSSA